VKVLTREREARGWSRSELARRASVNAATVGQIEIGRLIPYDVQLQKIAAALSWTGEPAKLMEEVHSGPAA
jgi:transcriptional regulator with XRE-family HTH domain